MWGAAGAGPALLPKVQEQWAPKSPRTFKQARHAKKTKGEEKPSTLGGSGSVAVGLGRAKAFLASLQQTKALTSQAVQLTHPAVLILLGNDLQKRTGQGSEPSQSRCPHTGWAEIKLIQHLLALYREGEEAAGSMRARPHTHRDDVIFTEA